MRKCVRSRGGWSGPEPGSVVRDRAQLVGERTRLRRDALAPLGVAVLDGAPVVDLDVDVALAQDESFGLDREMALLLLEELALLAGRLVAAPVVGHVLAHVVDRHPGRREAGDPHQLVEVVVVVDPVPAGRAATDRRDDADLLVVAQRAGGQAGQGCRLLDGVAAGGGVGGHVMDGRNFEYSKSKRPWVTPSPGCGQGGGACGRTT